MKGVFRVSLNNASTSGWKSAKDCKIPIFPFPASFDGTSFDNSKFQDFCMRSIGKPLGQHVFSGAPNDGYGL